jgi:hypothetical protein
MDIVRGGRDLQPMAGGDVRGIPIVHSGVALEVVTEASLGAVAERHEADAICCRVLENCTGEDGAEVAAAVVQGCNAVAGGGVVVRWAPVGQKNFAGDKTDGRCRIHRGWKRKSLDVDPAKVLFVGIMDEQAGRPEQQNCSERATQCTELTPPSAERSHSCMFILRS